MTPYALVQDFHDDKQVFRVGVKPLSIGSVDAAYGNRNRVVPVAAAHLTREIPQDYCRSGGSIDPSQSALNTSMLDDVPMNAAAIADRAIALMEQHGIKWRSLRKDKIMATETIISMPPGFAGDVDAFLADSLYFTEHIAFGHRVPVIAAVVHVDEMTTEMARPHLHVLTLPITPDGRMDGHDLVGFKGKDRKRNDLFYEHVGKRYGLSKPTFKVSLNKADRVRLADWLLAKFAADCPAWACNPAAMKALRKMFIDDPLGMAKAHGITLPQIDQAKHQEAGTAYMRSVDDVSLPASETYRIPVNAVATGTQPDIGVDGHHDANIGPAGDDGDASPVAMPLADPAPQPDMPMPIRILVSAVDPGPNAAADEPPERLVRVRDADLPADRWDCDRGEHIELPPPKQAKRQQVLLGVRMALGSMASAGRPRTPQVAPQAPAPVVEAKDDRVQPAVLSPARLALAKARAERAAKADLPISPARQPALASLTQAAMAR